MQVKFVQNFSTFRNIIENNITNLTQNIKPEKI